MVTINLSNLALQDIEGNSIENNFDLHKIIGNAFYFNATDIEMLDVAKKLYETGELVCEENKLSIFKEFVESDRCPIVAFVKEAVLKELKM